MATQQTKAEKATGKGTELGKKTELLYRLGKRHEKVVVKIIAYDTKLDKVKYWETVRKTHVENDEVVDESDGDVHVTFTADDLVNEGLMWQSECQPYNASLVGTVIYMVNGGRLPQFIIDADLIHGQVPTITGQLEMIERWSEKPKLLSWI